MATAFGPKKMPSTYKGKSTELGKGGRAAKMKDELESEDLPGGEKEVGAIIGKNARAKQAAPGQKYYRPSAKKK